MQGERKLTLSAARVRHTRVIGWGRITHSYLEHVLEEDPLPTVISIRKTQISVGQNFSEQDVARESDGTRIMTSGGVLFGQRLLAPWSGR